MSPIDQIREAIETRIAKLQHEMVALQAARAALRGETAVRATPPASTKRAAKPRRRRVAPVAGNGSSPDGAAVTTNGAAVKVPAAAADPAPANSLARPSRARTQRQPVQSKQPVEVLLAGKLELMLGEAADGLSAVTISKRSNAGYDQVRDLLRDLESTGQVRRTGTRRTSLWRLITDEERIAKRAAELARLSTGIARPRARVVRRRP
jgi:hypothetical protein